MDNYNKYKSTFIKNFYGRENELEILKDFVVNGSGSLMVWGDPGIGKSTLMAQFMESIICSINTNENASSAPVIIKYFADRNRDKEHFVNSLNKQFNEMFKYTSSVQYTNTDDIFEEIISSLEKISKHSRDKEIVLIIDGLDECSQISNYIPDPDFFPCIKLLLSSRKSGDIRDWYKTWNREQSQSIELNKLDEKIIKLMINDFAAQKNLKIYDDYLLAVSSISEGNPLFLTLFFKEISYQQKLIPIKEIPQGIDNLICDIIQRITEQGENNKARELILLLTVAKSDLTYSAIADFLDITSIEAQFVVERCMEVLTETESNQKTFAYQLFHEYIRDWIILNHQIDYKRTNAQLSDKCYLYDEREEDAKLYALEHAVKHLIEKDDSEKVWQILQDNDFSDLQTNTFEHYNETIQDINKGIEYYIRRNGQHDLDDPRLCWLLLRSGEILEKSQNDYKIAFDWVQKSPNKMPEALDRIKILETLDYFKALLLLLWIETNRQAELPPKKRTSKYAQKVIDKIILLEENTPFFDWKSIFSPDFMSWYTKYIISIFNDINMVFFFKSTTKKSEYLRCLYYETKNESGKIKKLMLAQIENDIESVNELSEKLSLLHFVIKNFSKEESFRILREYYKKAMQYAQKITDRYQRIDVYINLFQDDRIHEDKQLSNKIAELTLEGILDIKNRTYFQSFVLSIESIVKKFIDIGYIEKVELLINTLMDRYFIDPKVIDKCRFYTAIAYAEQGYFEIANELAQNKIIDIPNRFYVFTLIYIKTKNDYSEFANEYYTNIMDNALHCGNQLNVSNAFSGMIDAMIAFNECDKARELLENITDEFIKAKNISNITKVLIQKVKLEEAQKLAEDIQIEYLRDEIFLILIPKILKQNKSEYYELLNRINNKHFLMLAIHHSILDLLDQNKLIDVKKIFTKYPNDLSAAVIVDKYIDRNEFGEARNIIDLIENETKKTKLLIHLAYTYYLAGQLIESCNLFKEILVFLEKNRVDCEDLYLELAIYLAKTTIDIPIEEITGNIISKNQKDEVFSEVSQIFLNQSKPDLALHYAKQISDNELYSETISKLSKTLYLMSFPQRAIDIFKNIFPEQVPYNAIIPAKLLDILGTIVTTNSKHIEMILNNILLNIENYPVTFDGHTQIRLIMKIANLFCLINQADRSKCLYDEALNIARKKKYKKHKYFNVVIESMDESCSKKYSYYIKDRILKNLEMLDEADKNRIYCELSKLATSIGELKEASLMAEKITDISIFLKIRAYAYQEAYLLKKGRIKEVGKLLNNKIALDQISYLPYYINEYYELLYAYLIGGYMKCAIKLHEKYFNKPLTENEKLKFRTVILLGKFKKNTLTTDDVRKNPEINIILRNCSKINDKYINTKIIIELIDMTPKLINICFINNYLFIKRHINIDYDRVTRIWQKKLMNYLPSTISLLRANTTSDKYFIDRHIKVYTILLSHLKLSNWQQFESIIQLCPQLNLDFLLPQKIFYPVKDDYTICSFMGVEYKFPPTAAKIIKYMKENEIYEIHHETLLIEAGIKKPGLDSDYRVDGYFRRSINGKKNVVLRAWKTLITQNDGIVKLKIPIA